MLAPPSNVFINVHAQLHQPLPLHFSKHTPSTPQKRSNPSTSSREKNMLPKNVHPLYFLKHNHLHFTTCTPSASSNINPSTSQNIPLHFTKWSPLHFKECTPLHFTKCISPLHRVYIHFTKCPPPPTSQSLPPSISQTVLSLLFTKCNPSNPSKVETYPST